MIQDIDSFKSFVTSVQQPKLLSYGQGQREYCLYKFVQDGRTQLKTISDCGRVCFNLKVLTLQLDQCSDS